MRYIVSLLALFGAHAVLAERPDALLPYCGENLTDVAYLDTGLYPGADMKVELDLSFTSLTGNRGFGGCKPTSDFTLSFLARNGDVSPKKFYFAYKKNIDIYQPGTTDLLVPVKDTRYKVTTELAKGHQSCVIEQNGVVVGIGEGNSTEEAPTSKYTITLGKYRKNDGTVASTSYSRIYRAKLYTAPNGDGNYRLVRDFRPAIKDGKPGFWDAVEEKMYYSADSKDFSYGSSRTCTWTGAGDGVHWSDFDNWEDGLSPVGTANLVNEGVFTTAAGELKMTNDLATATFDNFKATGANRLTLDGNSFTLRIPSTSTSSAIFYQNTCPVTVNTPITISGSKSGAFNVSGGDGMEDNVFNGQITLAGSPSFFVRGTAKHVRFAAPIIGADGTLAFCMSGTTEEVLPRLEASVDVKTMTCGTGKYIGVPQLLATGNKVRVLNVDAFAPDLPANDAFAHEDFGTVVNWRTNYYVHARLGAQNLRIGDGTVQTFDRFVGDPAVRAGNEILETGYQETQFVTTMTDGGRAEIVLRPTADALAYCCLRDGISLTVDSAGGFTQEFRDRAHPMSGSIAVKSGGLRVSGTNAFVNVRSVDVRGAGRLEIATGAAAVPAFPALRDLKVAAGGVCAVTTPDAVAFTDGTVYVRLEPGAKFEMAQDATVTLARLFVGDDEVAAGTYTSEEWLDGAGTVVVTGVGATDYTFWTGRGEAGAWNDAANWSGGSPTAEATAQIALQSDVDVNVEIPRGAGFPRILSLGNRGAGQVTLALSDDVAVTSGTIVVDRGSRFEIPQGAALRIDGDASIDVRGGGELAVTGGELTLTNYTGVVKVAGGTDAADGASLVARVTMNTGLIRVASSSADRFLVMEQGILEVGGGDFVVVNEAQTKYPFAVKGGQVSFAGSGRYVAAGVSTASEYCPDTRFGTGETVFGGESAFLCEDGPLSASGRFEVKPDAVGETAMLVFTDHAAFKGENDGVCIGGTAGGRAIVRLASDASHAVFMNQLEVGSTDGYGELEVAGGWAGAGRRGVSVGGSVSTSTKEPTGLEGLLRVTGGVFDAVASSPWEESRLQGLCVGTASQGKMTDRSKRPFVGTVELEGGVISNNFSYTVIGSGYGRGVFHQTGGEFRQTHTAATRGLVIGLFGGVGEYLMEGGEASVRTTVYVGGCFTNSLYLGRKLGGHCIGRGDAEGTLAIAGGSFSCDGSLTVGRHGAGTVEMRGSEGTLAAGTLTLESGAFEATSDREAYTSASTLKFTFDAQGVSPIKVAKSTTISEGAKLVIDTSAYAGGDPRNFWLVRCPDVQGSFAEENVTLTGPLARRSVVEAVAGGLRLKTFGSTVIILR